MSGQRDRWTSDIGFLTAAVGSAVGLGTIWRFPYSIGSSGGGAYVLAYLLVVSLVVLPILMAEMVIGRRAQRSPPDAMRAAAQESGASPAWHWVATTQFLGAFIVLAFYCVVGGWTLAYVLPMASGAFDGQGPAEVQALFDALNASASRMVFWHGLFLVLTAGVSIGGISAGVERISNILMPLFFLMLLGLAIYACAVGDFAATSRFLFQPDITKLTADVWLNVLGQAFFSIGAGSTVYMAYASYAGKSLNIVRASWVIALAVVFVSILAGLAIFPIVFQYGLSPNSGPGLAFVTLPLAFAKMPGGQFFGVVFLLLLFVAAITSSVSMLEVTVSRFVDRFQMSRRAAVLSATAIAWVLGVLAALSSNVLADVHPLAMVPAFAKKTFFDLFNEFAANVLLPVGGLCLTIFAGWIMRDAATAAELGTNEASAGFRVWRFLIRYVAPVAVVVVFWMSTFG